MNTLLIIYIPYSSLYILTVCLNREKAPGQRECDDAIEVLNRCIREVDQASLAAISQHLTPREDISMEVNTTFSLHTKASFVLITIL